MGWISTFRSKTDGNGAIPVVPLGSQSTPSSEENAKARSAMLESRKPIDVRELMQLYTVEELCQTAEDYYSGVKDCSGLLAKPFVCLSETPELLMCFGQLLYGLKPVEGLDILDFGAGPGWASHALTQLGAKMIVCDVSASALKISAERFQRFPIPTQHTPPKFLHFDGRQFDLPDACVDRIVCIDAFHHVPNPAEVIMEMGRILRDGGVAAFAEPGPKHSWSPGAQYEMRHHQVVENDVVIEDIWRMAQAAGFGDLRLSVFGTTPFQVTLDEFDDFLNGGRPAAQCLQGIQHYMQNSRRLFFFSKGASRPQGSRSSDGLKAAISLGPQPRQVRSGERQKITVNVRNAGKAHWLPPSQGMGSVWLGAHLTGPSGKTQTGYLTHPLPIEETDGLLPGKSVSLEIEIDAFDHAGRYTLEFDLVSQQIAWFNTVGSPTVKRTFEVVD